MKPRQRLNQKQKSRLYCRGNDHRELLWYDDSQQKFIYNNALYWTAVDQNKVLKENVAWVKFLHNSLIHYQSGSSSVQGSLCCMDVDRQFNHGINKGNTNKRNFVFGLECGIAVFTDARGSNDSYVYITEDGTIWQKIELTDNDYTYVNQQYIYKFGEDGLCYFTKNSGTVDTFSFKTIIFKKNETTDRWEYETHTYSFVASYSFNVLNFVCNTKQGCILCHSEQGYISGGDNYFTNVQYVHIDHSGVKTDKAYVMQTQAPLFTNEIMYSSYVKNNNQCSCIVWNAYAPNQYRATRYNRLFIATTSDNGNTWEIEKIDELNTSDGAYSGRVAVDMYARCGKTYAIYACPALLNNKAHIYEVGANGVNTEVSLPSWIDLPVIQGGGACVKHNPSVGDSIRIAVSPADTSDADVTLSSLIQSGRMPILNNGNGNILFRDGEKVECDSDEDFFLCLGLNSGYKAFFDNPQLAESSKAFAWQSDYQLNEPQTKDYVISYDYVLG